MSTTTTTMTMKMICQSVLPAVSLVLDLECEEAESNSMILILRKYQPLTVLFVVVVVVAVVGVWEQLSGLVGRNQRSAAHCATTTDIAFMSAKAGCGHGGMGTHIQYCVAWVTRSLHYHKQDVDPFRRLCTSRQRDRLTNAGISDRNSLHFTFRCGLALLIIN